MDKWKIGTRLAPAFGLVLYCATFQRIGTTHGPHGRTGFNRESARGLSALPPKRTAKVTPAGGDDDWETF